MTRPNKANLRTLLFGPDPANVALGLAILEGHINHYKERAERLEGLYWSAKAAGCFDTSDIWEGWEIAEIEAYCAEDYAINVINPMPGITLWPWPEWLQSEYPAGPEGRDFDFTDNFFGKIVYWTLHVTHNYESYRTEIKRNAR